MFVEARIVCRVPRYLVQDLGLDLRQNQTVYYDRLQAHASKDLAHAVRVGAVELTYVKTSKEKRTSSTDQNQFPPYVRRLGQVPQAPPVEETPVDLEQELDTRFARFEEILRGRMVTMGREVQNTLLEELRGALPQLQLSEEKVASMVEASVSKAFEKHKGTMVVPVTQSSQGGSDGEPVFIPSDLTSSGGEAHISVKATSSKDKNLDDAAAALKAARKKGTRRKRTKKAE